MTPPKVSNSTIVGCNDKEVDEIPDKILKEWFRKESLLPQKSAIPL
jgi:hypothetical protein